MQALVYRHLPDDLGLPYMLWSRAAIWTLVGRDSGMRFAVRSTGIPDAVRFRGLETTVARLRAVGGGRAALAATRLPGHRGAG